MEGKAGMNKTNDLYFHVINPNVYITFATCNIFFIQHSSVKGPLCTVGFSGMNISRNGL